MTTRPLAIISALTSAAALAPAAAAQPTDAGLITRPGALLGRTTTIRGSFGSAAAGGRVVLQRRRADGTWRIVARARAGARGAFAAHWRADALGPTTLRAVPAGASARAAASPLTATLIVFRPVRATYYGPGFYGKRTACGQTMSTTLMGVAHRTLPCGTPVTVYFGGHAVTVPVVDRGPFANGAHYDLTTAVAESVGMTGTSTIGAIYRRGTTMAPPPPPGADASGGVAAAP